MSHDLVLLVGSANGPLPYVSVSKGTGISAYGFDSGAGKATLLSTCGEVLNPTFVAASMDGRFIGAVTERGDAAFGTLTTLALDTATGAMRTIGAASSMGVGPAHVSFSPDGTHIACANYSAAPLGQSAGASLAVHALNSDGAFLRLVGTATHIGSGPNAGRQERSHAHCARWSVDGRFVFVADLGTDELVSYRVTPAGLEKVAVLATPPGAGPRHLALHPNGHHAYLVAELSSTVLSLGYDAGEGRFTVLGQDTTLPAGGVDGSTCSAIHVTPDGRHVLAGNRGHDSLALLSIGSDGVARYVGTTPSGGRVPRDFAIDPSGRWVAVANQESDLVSLFRLADGQLAPAGTIATGSPTAVTFVKRS